MTYYGAPAFCAEINCQKGASLCHHITSIRHPGSIGLPPRDHTDRVRNRFIGNEDQIATAARARQFPTQRLVTVFINESFYTVIHHTWEHGNLCFECLAHGAPKAEDV